MKKYMPVLTGILLVLMTACSDTKKKNQQAEGTSSQLIEVGKIDESVKLSQSIEGQWKTEGGEGIVPHWREFDASNNSFHTWSHNGSKSSEQSGTYEVIGDTALVLNFNNNEAPRKYGLDSLSKDYLEIWYYGVSASNLIYQRAEYENNHLKDISKDTIAAEGKVIQAFDSGMAFTVGLHIDIGTDTLIVNYFSEKYNEYSLRDKQVTLRYYKTIEYNYANPESITKEYEITGTYRILSYGGDLPGAYSVTDKNGKVVVFEQYLDKSHDKFEGTVVTERYTERYKTNIASIEVAEPIMNTLVFGDWNIVSSDTTPIGHQQIKIRPGGKKGVYIDFGGQGENYVAADIYSNTLSGTNVSGTWTLELVSDDPATFMYSDDGQGGHFEPIKNQEYQKKASDNRKLLIGKWTGINNTEGYVEFTDREMTHSDSRPAPYILSSAIMNEELRERYSSLGISVSEVIYISTLDDGENFLNYSILKLDENNLSYTYMGTGNDFHFKKIK